MNELIQGSFTLDFLRLGNMQILFQWYQLDLNCRTDLLEELKIETVLSIAVKSFVNKRPIMLDRVFKNGPSKLCGRQPLKNFTWPILEYFVSYILGRILTKLLSVSVSAS